MTQVDIESKKQRRVREKCGEKLLSKLEKVVTPEGFVYYVENSSTNDRGNDCFFISDSDYEGSEVEETELPSKFFGFTQETSLKDISLMASEFLHWEAAKLI